MCSRFSTRSYIVMKLLSAHLLLLPVNNVTMFNLKLPLRASVVIVKAPQVCSSFLLNVVRTGGGITLFKSSLFLVEIKFHNVASVLPLVLWLLLGNKFSTRAQANPSRE